MRELQEQKEKQLKSLKLSEYSKREIEAYKKKKEEIKFYETNILKKKAQELRLSLAPNGLGDGYGKRLSQTPDIQKYPSGDVSGCTTYENCSPIRGSTTPLFSGA